MKSAGKYFGILAAVALLFGFGVLLARKIDLTTADLGRHILNGKIIVYGSWQQKWAVLHTNFYSFTMPNQPFINHHWLSGVVFYFLWRFFGFTGLSVLYVALGVATLWLFWDVARRGGNVWLATIASVAVLPLITSRAEVRPEMFTYFLTGLFFWLLWRWRQGQINRRWLFVFVPLMLVWVNLHIGFVFGFLVLGAFGLDELVKNLKLKITDKVQPLFSEEFNFLVLVAALCALAGLANPSFLKGFLYPLSIFHNYGYLIVENQSIPFLQRLGFAQTEHFLLYEIVASIVVLSFIAAAIKDRRRFDVVLLVVVVVSGVMAFWGVRNFPSFALFAVPALAVNINFILPRQEHLAYRIGLGLIGAGIAAVALFNQYQYFLQLEPAWGFGLLPGVEQTAVFLKANNIGGPVFNDYDIGSFLEFELYPQPVFVDNRPESYTPDFFQNEYIPAQQDEAAWQALDGKYNFNAIVFSYRDYTPWAQAFLIKRVSDPDWAPVFVDDYNIIFLKRDGQNRDLIQKYELPKSMFGIK